MNAAAPHPIAKTIAGLFMLASVGAGTGVDIANAETALETQAKELLSHDYGMVDPPVCHNPQGENVYYVPYAKAHFDWRNTLLAYSGRTEADGGKHPIIATDAETLSHTPPQVQMQVSAHECFHHWYGDIYTLPARRTPEVVKMQEDRADCESIKFLRDRKKYTADDIKIIAQYSEFLIMRFAHETAARKNDPGIIASEEIFAKNRTEKFWQCFNSAPKAP